MNSLLNRIKDIFSLYTISIFPLHSEKGIELLDALMKSYFNDALEHSYETPHCKIYVAIKRSIKIKVFDRTKYNVRTEDCIKSCHNDDLVIFDGSIEGKNNEINNYVLANALQYPLDHVLIVSRTYLPINIRTNRGGGFPSYKQQIISNDKILEWLGNELSQINFHQLRNRETKGFKKAPEYIKACRHKHNKIKSKECAVFISFRTKYAQKDNDSDLKYSVSELADRIENGFYGEPKTVKYLDNGSLVFNTELLTQWKAWQLLCIIGKEYIAHCDEMWIYATDDYLNSWWTLGEQILFAYCVQKNAESGTPDSCAKKLKIYYPKEDRIEEIHPVALNDIVVSNLSSIIRDCYPDDMDLYLKLSTIAARQILFGGEEQFKNGVSFFGEYVLKIKVRELIKEGLSVQEILDNLTDTEDEFWLQFYQMCNDLRTRFLTDNLTENDFVYLEAAREFMKERSKMFEEELDIPLQHLVNHLMERLKNPFLSEEFWEHIIINKDLNLETGISDIRSILTEENIMKHLSMDFPGHRVVSNIFHIKEGDVIDGKRVLRKPSRYIYMPLLENEIDPSPTHNSLYEMPVYIIE